MARQTQNLRPRTQRPVPLSRPGAPPGTLVAPPDAQATSIRLIDYSGEDLVETEVTRIAELRARVEGDTVSWIDVVGLADVDRIAELGLLLGVSPLVLEDILSVGQRSKLERTGTPMQLASQET